MAIKKTTWALGSTLALSLLVVGCGGHHNDTPPFDFSGADNKAEPVAAQDSFIDAVRGVIAATSETTEPGSIDSIMVTTPNNTAPLPLS